MSRYYRRTTPGPRENLGAGLFALGLGAGVAAVTFYLARLLLARERLEPAPSPLSPAGAVRPPQPAPRRLGPADAAEPPDQETGA